MKNILGIIQIISASLLVVSILLQSRGSGLGGIFGGGGEFYRTKRGAEKFLFYLAVGSAAVFFGSVVFTILK